MLRGIVSILTLSLNDEKFHRIMLVSWNIIMDMNIDMMG